MATIEFKNHEYINPLGTGCTKQQVHVLCELDDNYFDSVGGNAAVFDMCGSLDAPDEIPNGATLRAQYQPLVNSRTRPGSVSR